MTLNILKESLNHVYLINLWLFGVTYFGEKKPVFWQHIFSNFFAIFRHFTAQYVLWNWKVKTLSFLAFCGTNLGLKAFMKLTPGGHKQRFVYQELSALIKIKDNLHEFKKVVERFNSWESFEAVFCLNASTFIGLIKVVNDIECGHENTPKLFKQAMISLHRMADEGLIREFFFFFSPF